MMLKTTPSPLSKLLLEPNKLPCSKTCNSVKSTVVSTQVMLLATREETEVSNMIEPFKIQWLYFISQYLI